MSNHLVCSNQSYFEGSMLRRGKLYIFFIPLVKLLPHTNFGFNAFIFIIVVQVITKIVCSIKSKIPSRYVYWLLYCIMIWQVLCSIALVLTAKPLKVLLTPPPFSCMMVAAIYSFRSFFCLTYFYSLISAPCSFGVE